MTIYTIFSKKEYGCNMVFPKKVAGCIRSIGSSPVLLL